MCKLIVGAEYVVFDTKPLSVMEADTGVTLMAIGWAADVDSRLLAKACFKNTTRYVWLHSAIQPEFDIVM